MINIENGFFTITDGLTVFPGYTFEHLKYTRFADKSSIIEGDVQYRTLHGVQTINNRNFIVGLHFWKGKLWSVSMTSTDKEFEDTIEGEMERKKFHDEILWKDLGIREKKEFSWGEIYSYFDPKNGSSSISIRYY